MARKEFFMNAKFFDQTRFQTPKTAEYGHWIVYTLNNGQNYTEKLERDGISENLKKCIGKSIGDEFIIQPKYFGDIEKLKIVSIMTDERKILDDINSEAFNPALGSVMKGYNFKSTSGEGMIKELQSLVGFQGSKKQISIDESLKKFYNYELAYSEIVRSIFRDDHITGYEVLTSKPHNFPVLPSIFLQLIEFDTSDNFILDFSSLTHFYHLEEDLNLSFKKTKFIVSPAVVEEIKDSIKDLELNNPNATLQITAHSFIPYEYPDDYKEKRTSFLSKILNWISENCDIEYNIDEKLDLALSLEVSSKNDNIMGLMLDHACLMERDRYFLITNDILFYMAMPKFRDKIISVEMFSNKIYPEYNTLDLDRFLLKKRYVGQSFNFEVLKAEFLDKLSGRGNNYDRCLLNMNYELSEPHNFITEIIKFLKFIYSMSSLRIEDKQRHANNIFQRCLRNTNQITRNIFYRNIKDNFNVMGEYYDSVLETFRIAEKTLFNK